MSLHAKTTVTVIFISINASSFFSVPIPAKYEKYRKDMKKIGIFLKICEIEVLLYPKYFMYIILINIKKTSNDYVDPPWLASDLLLTCLWLAYDLLMSCLWLIYDLLLLLLQLVDNGLWLMVFAYWRQSNREISLPQAWGDKHFCKVYLKYFTRKMKKNNFFIRNISFSHIDGSQIKKSPYCLY